nr:MAG TPA: hypothetical protein [Caudoviricetes sp.]
MISISHMKLAYSDHCQPTPKRQWSFSKRKISPGWLLRDFSFLTGTNQRSHFLCGLFYCA